MTPKELKTKLAQRASRWHDELDSYAAELVRLIIEDLDIEYVQAAIDNVVEKKK